LQSSWKLVKVISALGLKLSANVKVVAEVAELA
jgi:hypothetical protein